MTGEKKDTSGTRLYTKGLQIIPREGETVTPEDWKVATELGDQRQKQKGSKRGVALRIVDAIKELPTQEP